MTGGPGTADSPAEPGASTMVVVPRQPGRLRAVGGSGRTRDELDELIDDIFGQSTDERPGIFDVVLIGLGVVLLAWSLVLGGPDLATWIGLFAVLLGVALPLRGAVRGFGRRRTRAARERAVAEGYVLDTSHPATAELAAVYDRLCDAARLPNVQEPSRIVAAGHLAMVEVATLLKGAPPFAPEQVTYVARRTEAMRSVTSGLLAGHERWVAEATAANQSAAAEDREWAAALTAAREELESTARTGSLSELDQLRGQVGRDAPDAA